MKGVREIIRRSHGPGGMIDGRMDGRTHTQVCLCESVNPSEANLSTRCRAVFHQSVCVMLCVQLMLACLPACLSVSLIINKLLSKHDEAMKVNIEHRQGEIEAV